MQRLSILFLGLLLGMSCLAAAFSPEDEITVSLREKQIQELSPEGLNLVFYVDIKNASSKTYFLSSYAYRFVVDQQEYLRLDTHLDKKLRVDAGRDTLIALPVKITYELLFQAISGISGADKAACYMRGELAFADAKRERGRVSFGFSGEFPIFRKPEFEFLLFDVKTLTIGGADLALVLKIKNNNGFELLPDRIEYRVAIGGRPVGGDRIRGDKSIGSHGEKTFSLPILLNFFEVGKEIHAFLQQDSVPCRFSGEIGIKTVWGRIVIPFDEHQHIPVKKGS